MAAEQSYLLRLSSAAKKALAEDLPPHTAFAAWEFISGPLCQVPDKVGAPLRAPFTGQWRARRGDYRVRYRIDEAAHLIYVTGIFHRRDAYRG